MTPTAELETRLRKYLNEKIPANGTDADTNFTNAEIDDLLTQASNIYEAAAAGWTIKAGLIGEKIESYGVGQEKYDLTSLKDLHQQALAMAEKYAGLGKTNIGSVILALTPPEVL